MGHPSSKPRGLWAYESELPLVTLSHSFANGTLGILGLGIDTLSYRSVYFFPAVGIHCEHQ